MLPFEINRLCFSPVAMPSSFTLNVVLLSSSSFVLSVQTNLSSNKTQAFISHLHGLTLSFFSKTAFDLYESPHPYVTTTSTLTKSPKTLSQTSALHSNFLTRSNFLRKRMVKIFTVLDTDGSKSLSTAELYTGVVLLHLELAKYFGPAACKPPDRQVVAAMFFKFDSDGSKSLDIEEFCSLMIILLSNILSRVLFQFFMTIMLVPLAAPQLASAVKNMWLAAAASYAAYRESGSLAASLAASFSTVAFARELFDVHVASTDRWQLLSEAVSPHWQLLSEVVSPHWKLLCEAVASRWQLLLEEVSPHWQLLCAPHWKLLCSAVAPHLTMTLGITVASSVIVAVIVPATLDAIDNASVAVSEWKRKKVKRGRKVP